MPDESLSPRAVRSNIETIIRLEEEDEQRRTVLERLSEAIGRFAGTLWFVALQVSFVLFWIGANLGLIPEITPFDPYPFSFLSVVLGLEAVLFTAFVLIRQNRMSFLADRRNHIDLQVNLLSEKEITKVIQMLERISRGLGIEATTVDQEVKELGETTAVESLAREVGENVEELGR